MQDDAIALLKAVSRSKESDQLAKNVRGEDSRWLVAAPLWEVTLRLWALYRYNPSIAGEDNYVLFTKRLVEAEDAPGGPYRAQDSATDILNLLLLRLFREFKRPLRHVEDFVREHVAGYDMDDPLVAFLMQFPDELTDTVEKARTTRAAPVAATQYVRGLRGLLRRDAQKYVGKTLRMDAKRGEISTLSRHAAEALGMKYDMRVLKLLADANIHLWVAYTLYDHVLDGESDAKSIPIANHYHRQSYAHFLQIASSISQVGLVDSFFLSMDAANRWELEYARATIDQSSINITHIPEYKDGRVLAERAAGHILGPVLLSHRVSRLTSGMRKRYEKGLRQYLIARQLSDDLHDWVEDLTNGRLSFVVSYLLSIEGIVPGTYDRELLMKKLQKTFWETGFEQLAEIVGEHVRSSVCLLKSVHASDATGERFLQITLRPIEDSLHESLQKYRQQKSFVEEYKKSSHV